jgi:hypothetical protein
MIASMPSVEPETGLLAREWTRFPTGRERRKKCYLRK